ncbi:hypothetical protein [Prosthecobacter sp.]|uniref:hypothetical protein n=1 Tax=Prosthecobacter sp. TaxID=1965333 RepID=UPI00378444E0
MFQIAVGALASVIVALFGYIVKDHHECRRDRLSLRKLFEKTLEELSFIKGQLAIYKSVFRKLNISLPEAAVEEGPEQEG